MKIKLPNNYYQLKITKLRELMHQESCDAFLIYGAEKEDPAFLPWLLGNYIFETTYLLITSQKVILFIPQWRLFDAQKMYTALPLSFVGTPEKATMMRSVIPCLTNIQTIGYAGNVPYKEMILLPNKKLKNIEKVLRSLYEIKDNLELKILTKAFNFTRVFMKNLSWNNLINKTELEITQIIEEKIRQKQLLIAHLCISSGARLKQTTAGLPTKCLIKKNDIVCLDFGIFLQTYCSDITNCYFLGKAQEKYLLAYQKLQQIVFNVAEKIKAGMQSKKIFNIFKEEFKKAGMTKSFVPTDLGHGIGTGNHEYPEIGFGNNILQKRNVFTLEPEARLSDGTLLRHEEVFYIGDDGKAKLLT